MIFNKPMKEGTTMKNIKHIILVALAALALGLASVGVAAPSLAGGHSTSGDFHAGIAAPEPSVAGSKPGIAGGQGEMHTVASAPRITIDAGLSGGVVLGH